jgi:D-beta-D-heptose 7-phosphate kinase/D-beta-D-heptose 1-phosphate adenosyltransferase
MIPAAMDFHRKILKPLALKKKLDTLRRAGHVIVFTNGCFDILHRGHVTYLAQAKKNASRILVVGLNSDASVRSLNKGPDRPIVPEAERAAVLAALAAVDFVAVFNESTPYELIRQLQPDILLKGADWKGKAVAGSDIVEARGGRVEFVPFIAGLSSTNVIEKIKGLCLKR